MNRTVILALIAGIVLLIAAMFLLSNQVPGISDENAGRQPVAEQDVTVNLTPSGFNPATITIKKGERVRWTNNITSAASVDSTPHPMHNAYPPLNLGLFQPGETLEFVFPEPGTYQYHNHLTPTMEGTVVVQ